MTVPNIAQWNYPTLPAGTDLPTYIGQQNKTFQQLTQMTRQLRTGVQNTQANPYVVTGLIANSAAAADAATNRLAIQTMLNFVNSIGGGTVYIPAGLYYLDTPNHPQSANPTSLYIWSNTRLTGSAAGTTIFKFLPTNSAIPAYFIQNANNRVGFVDVNIEIAFLTLDGNLSNRPNEPNDFGIALWQIHQGAVVHDVIVQNLQATSGGGTGEAFAIAMNGCQDWEVRDCWGQNGGVAFCGGGFLGNPCSRGRFVNCTSVNSYGNAFTINGCDTIMYLGCAAYNSGTQGWSTFSVAFNSESCRHTTYHGCVVDTAVYGGFLQTAGSMGGSFSGCEISNTAHAYLFTNGGPGYNPQWDITGLPYVVNLASGQPITGSSTTTITNSAATWTVNQWANQYVMISGGPHAFLAGYASKITSNTATTLTLTTALTSAPIVGSDTFQIQTVMPSNGSNLATLGGGTVTNCTTALQHDSGSLHGVAPAIGGNVTIPYATTSAVTLPTALVGSMTQFTTGQELAGFTFGQQQGVNAFDATQAVHGLVTLDGSSNTVFRSPGTFFFDRTTGVAVAFIDQSGDLEYIGAMQGVATTNVTKTANYTAVVTDTTIFIDTTSNAVTITLPPSSSNFGRVYQIKWIRGANAAKIAPNGSDQIEGVNATYTIPTLLNSVSPQSDGGGHYWFT